MPSLFKGVRTFVEAIRRGADNIVYNLIRIATLPTNILEGITEKFPDLPPVAAQMTIDYTSRTKEYGEYVNLLPSSAVLPYGSAPSSPVTGQNATYWMDVEWFDPRSGEMGRRLTIVNGRPGETKEQAEERARQLSKDYWKDYPEFDNQGRRIDPEFRGVTWLRGYQGGTAQ